MFSPPKNVKRSDTTLPNSVSVPPGSHEHSVSVPTGSHEHSVSVSTSSHEHSVSVPTGSHEHSVVYIAKLENKGRGLHEQTNVSSNHFWNS